VLQGGVTCEDLRALCVTESLAHNSCSIMQCGVAIVQSDEPSPRSPVSRRLGVMVTRSDGHSC